MPRRTTKKKKSTRGIKKRTSRSSLNPRSFKHFINEVPIITALANSKPSQRKTVAKTLTTQQLRAIQEIVRGALENAIPLPHQDANKLRKYSTHLDRINRDVAPFVTTKRIMASDQNGGFLPFLALPAMKALAPALAPVAGQLIGSLIK